MNDAEGESLLDLARSARDFYSRRSVEVIAGVWFFIALGTILWAWGLNPIVFQVTDEAVVRQAARLISQHGDLFQPLPFPDPEDVLHMRQWVSVGDHAIPIYAPVALYGYGFLLRVHGLFAVELFPSAAVAAFAAATARLLPFSRRWLALLAPPLGFVSFYWILHPWMLLTPVLACLCWAFLFWTLWREDDGSSPRWLVAITLSVGLASAIRPDYAGFLLLWMMLLLLSDDLRKWKLIVGLSVLAGVFAVIPNLILNKITTGHALRAAYQIALDRQYGVDGTHGLESPHGFPGFSVVRVLFAPMGLPSFAVGATEFKKYFLTMSIAPALLLGQLAIIPIVRKRTLISLLLLLGTLFLAVFFVVAHLHDDLFGGDEPRGFVYHSVPRYLSPLFLFAALPPLLFLGRLRRGLPLVLGSTLAVIITLKGAYDVFVSQPASLSDVHHWVPSKTAMLETLASKIPKDAIVYSAYADKVLWSKWQLGMIDKIPQTVSSMSRAMAAGLPVFVMEPSVGPEFRELRMALREKQFSLVRIDPHHGLYRLDPDYSPVQ